MARRRFSVLAALEAPALQLTDGQLDLKRLRLDEDALWRWVGDILPRCNKIERLQLIAHVLTPGLSAGRREAERLLHFLLKQDASGPVRSMAARALLDAGRLTVREMLSLIEDHELMTFVFIIDGLSTEKTMLRPDRLLIALVQKGRANVLRRLLYAPDIAPAIRVEAIRAAASLRWEAALDATILYRREIEEELFRLVPSLLCLGSDRAFRLVAEIVHGRPTEAPVFPHPAKLPGHAPGRWVRWLAERLEEAMREASDPDKAILTKSWVGWFGRQQHPLVPHLVLDMSRRFLHTAWGSVLVGCLRHHRRDEVRLFLRRVVREGPHREEAALALLCLGDAAGIALLEEAIRENRPLNTRHLKEALQRWPHVRLLRLLPVAIGHQAELLAQAEGAQTAHYRALALLKEPKEAPFYIKKVGRLSSPELFRHLVKEHIFSKDSVAREDYLSVASAVGPLEAEWLAKQALCRKDLFLRVARIAAHVKADVGKQLRARLLRYALQQYEGKELLEAVDLLLHGRTAGDVVELLLSKARRDARLHKLVVRKLSCLPERQLLKVLRRESWLCSQKELLLRLQASPERNGWILRSCDESLVAAVLCEQRLPRLSESLNGMHYEATTIARLIEATPLRRAERLAVGIATVLQRSPGNLPPSDHLWWRTLQLRLHSREHLLLGNALLHYLSFMHRLVGEALQRLERMPVGQLPLVPDTSTISRWVVRVRPSLLLENHDVLLAAGAYLLRLQQMEHADSREPVSGRLFLIERLVDMLWRQRVVLARQAASFELMRSNHAEAFLRRLVVDYGVPSPEYDPTGAVPVLRIETRAGEVVQPFNEATARNVLNVTLRWDWHLGERLQEELAAYLRRPLPPPPDLERLEQIAYALANDIVRGSGRPLASRSFAMTPLVSLTRCRQADETKELAERILVHWEHHRLCLSEAMLTRCLEETRRLLFGRKHVQERS